MTGEPAAVGLGENAFVIVGRFSTVSVPLAAAALLPPLAVARPPAATVFTWLPATVPITLTVTVHEPFAGIVPPESATEVPAATAVTVPPQLLTPAGEASFEMPAG